MEKNAIHPGKHYAIRERRSPDEPFQRVKVLEAVRSGKWRVEWVNSSVLDYAAPSARLPFAPITQSDRSRLMLAERGIQDPASSFTHPHCREPVGLNGRTLR